MADALGRGRCRGAGDRTVTTELVVVETAGDRRRDLPIGAIGGQGVFVKEVEQALLDGGRTSRFTPPRTCRRPRRPDELDDRRGARRADPRDALVGLGLSELGPGARVATGATRRRAQLAWLRPDLRFEELRGNVGTRLDKVPAAGAVVVAFAARSSVSGSPGWRPRCSRPRRCSPRSAKARSRSSAGRADGATAAGGPLDRRRRRPPLPRRRTGLPG